MLALVFGLAVSIARRLQDPMAELVKIEPKHIGVGMYQVPADHVAFINTLEIII